MLPFSLYLIFYKHLQLISFLPGGKWTITHVFLLSKDTISAFMALCHLRSDDASLNDLGYEILEMEAKNDWYDDKSLW